VVTWKPTRTAPSYGASRFQMGKNASYAAAERGDFVMIKIGGILRVNVAATDRKFGLETEAIERAEQAAFPAASGGV
jgi:hypothetical protein